MDTIRVLEALLLGVVEGATEFIPVSSTGHILLLGHFLGFESTGKTFEVLIQLGAILAILTVYAHRLWSIATALPSDPSAQRFVLGVLIAFLPAAIVGALSHDFIKSVLFETPLVICLALILGGIALLWIDKLKLEVRYTDATKFPLPTYLFIGIFQCLAMIPGVSRSGSTIAGALLLGTSKRAAAEFSFFLAMPTMAGAFTLDLYKNRDMLSADDLAVTAIGFVAAFITAVIVVKTVLDYVTRHGFALFAWWRIIVGSAGLVGLMLVG
jgi:undecaprenyl-diphosphatase